ncbi:MAG: tail fiber domain-containing protein [Tagaea sp.]|nr:tail fiber domain-containing protein [Tagaea sp.]
MSGPLLLGDVQPGSGADLVWNSSTNTVGIQSASSARFKENIRKFKTDFGRVLGLNPVAFTYKETKDETVGYLAEDVAAQELDELITRDSEGKPFSVHYKLISVYLVELVKRQQALIETLQEKVAKVEARFAGDASPATA